MPEDADVGKSGEPVACPRCGETVPTDRVTCANCGEVARIKPSEYANTFPPPIPSDQLGLQSSDEDKGGARHQAIWRGIAWGNVAGLVIVAAGGLLVRLTSQGDTSFFSSGTYIVTEIVLAPLVIGMIAGYFWAPAAPSCAELLGYTLASMLIGFIIAAVFVHEGVICLGIASPLVWLLQMLGALAGMHLARRQSRLHLTLVPLMLAAFLHDAYAPHYYNSSVSDSVVIHAPARVVWSHLASFSRIDEPSHFWMFDAGLPMPMQSVASLPKPGAARACVFSHNDIFRERIIDAAPGKRLAFIILRQPRNPEIFDHATIREGEFDLRENRDGTTTLTGITRYSLHVFPGIYFDQWARLIGRNVHMRVMKHIKEECERT